MRTLVYVLCISWVYACVHVHMCACLWVEARGHCRQPGFFRSVGLGIEFRRQAWQQVHLPSPGTPSPTPHLARDQSLSILYLVDSRRDTSGSKG